MPDLNKNSNILMYCGNGYSFGEYFKPLIKDLLIDHKICFLQGNYCLTQATKNALEEIVCENKGFSYQLVPVFSNDYSRIKYHKEMRELINSLQKQIFDLLVLSTDFYLIDRYLIDFARSKGIKVVIMHANIMSPKALRIYRERSGICERIGIIKKFNRLKHRSLKALLSGVFRRFFLLVVWARNSWRNRLNYFVFPYFISRKIFPTSSYDRFNFTSGRGDMVICYDPMNVEVLKKAVPTVKNVFLAQHPSTYYADDPTEEGKKKLLVLLGGYSVELPESQVLFWDRSIKQILEKISLDEIHLRFHPRTKNYLSWPKKLIDLMGRHGCRVVVVDNENTPLAEFAADFVGVIGAVSGSLCTARSVCRGFVIGLLNASGDTNENNWMLGSGEGITWIRDGDEIREESLSPAYFSAVKNRQTVSGLIRRELLVGDRF
ncbi:MAG: hypothetical protein ABIC39_06495 [Pseudomonadota bacterium]